MSVGKQISPWSNKNWSLNKNKHIPVKEYRNVRLRYIDILFQALLLSAAASAAAATVIGICACLQTFQNEEKNKKLKHNVDSDRVSKREVNGVQRINIRR
jgi:hypothetical protein